MSKSDQVKACMPEVLNAWQRRACPHVEPDEIAVHVKNEFKEESDINYIMRRVEQHRVAPSWLDNRTPMYGDFTQLPQSLTEAHAITTRAQEAFMTLPAEMRRELDHDFRRLESAPRELFERYGLLKAQEERSGSAASTSGAAESSRGSASRKAAPAAQGSARKADQPSVDTEAPTAPN